MLSSYQYAEQASANSITPELLVGTTALIPEQVVLFIEEKTVTVVTKIWSYVECGAGYDQAVSASCCYKWIFVDISSGL